ncbi:MAG: alpha amylase C-terminal domain-containing protein [Mucinivorans sp.]
MENNILPIVAADEWLRPVAGEIEYRHHLYLDRLHLIQSASGSLRDYANAHLYYGVHRDPYAGGWWVRDWLPKAQQVYVFGDWNDWERFQFPMERDQWGGWSVFIPDERVAGRLKHESLLKLHVHGADDSYLDRIPAYIRRVVQNDKTKDFCGQVWAPEHKFDWKGDDFDISSIDNLLIYEVHVGMAQEKEGVGSYEEFTKNVLPRVKRLGYNTIQMMAVAEHPYYGSFGYHVSSLFAPSSRFGTPEQLKNLIKKAHSMGIGVIMDIVHSHYVKNINEGINRLDGSDDMYSIAGPGGDHPYWDSKLFDYAKFEVQHLLLSNVKYWLDEFHFDGYRFDGVSSMLYYHHGYADFGSYHSYFGDQVNRAALTYLSLANKLVKEVKPSAITIAEDVSGMPGLAVSLSDGGTGFDYRLAMAIPDFWIKYLKDTPDEQWDLWQMWDMMTNRLPNAKTIAYAESHDQALVGDKTIAFRLMDKEMYFSMDKKSKNIVVDRGIALHKMIRLMTITLGGDGYLNFMGNEFGHPEWIDFPREGNAWSYAHARRQWSLAENKLLRYGDLERFDKAMISLTKARHVLNSGYGYNLLNDQDNKTMVFEQAGLVYVMNWHPSASIMNYRMPVPMEGEYRIILNSDDTIYGGFGRVEDKTKFFTTTEDGRHYISIYNVSRTALVFEHVE